MQDAKSTLPSQNDVLPSLNPEQLQQIAELLAPALESIISASLSDVMSVNDFAKARGVSPSLVWRWLSEGVLLRAPTASSDNSGKEKTRVLINVSAWREKLRQQAINCRYINSKA